MKNRFALVTLIIVLFLAACNSGNEDEIPAVDETVDNGDVIVAATQPAGSGLTDGYDDALSIAGQLAIGTLQLEETDLAVDEAQATELLPLWQALQSLSNSDTTAAVELDAVARQIEETMSTDQVQAIADMALTNAGLIDLQESGALGFSFGGRVERAQAGDQSLPGSLRPGGLPGGRPGGGQGGGPGGGIGGFGGGEIDQEGRATRQAEFESGNRGVQGFLYINAVVRLLQVKTGEVPGNERAVLFAELYNVVSESTGLTVEELQSKLVEGQTLSEIIEEGGGDVSAVREVIISSLSTLSEVERPEDFNLEEFVDSWLGLMP